MFLPGLDLNSDRSFCHPAGNLSAGDSLGDHQLGEGVSYCQRANHQLFERHSIGFGLFSHSRSIRLFLSNRITVTEAILARSLQNGDGAGRWAVSAK